MWFRRKKKNDDEYSVVLQKGQGWTMHNIPWPEYNRCCVIILDVLDGWVKYKNLDYDRIDVMSVEKFKTVYRHRI